MKPALLRRIGLFLAGAMISVFSGPSAHAIVTDVAWYRLGEADPGANSGMIVNPTSQNNTGINHLTRYGSPRYTNAVATAAAFATDSSLAVNFDGFSQYLSNTVVAADVNSFGVEAWVRPGGANPGTFYIAGNGDANTAGWSIARNGSQFQAFYGPSAVITGGIATPGAWTHVALVRNFGTGTLYVNGTAVGTTSAFLNSSFGGFVVAARASMPVTGFFNGDIDEVRVFTFQPGQFNTNDLLLNRKNVRTLPPTSVTSGNATLNGSVYSTGNQPPLPVNGWFEWGPVPTYGNTTPPQNFGVGAVATNYSQAITGLTAGVTYQFRAVGNTGGNVIFGTNRFFTFNPQVMQVATLPASLNPQSATLNGAVNPGGVNALAWFEWGTTTNYGTSSALQAVGAGNSFTNFSEALGGLVSGMTYHFRAVASNSLGVLHGTNQTFTFPVFSPPVFSLAITNLPAVFGSSTAWGDYDNDGRLDILLTGYGTGGPVSQIWRNTGSEFTNVTAAIAPGLPGVVSGSVAWGDYDNDGRLDFLLTGNNAASEAIFQLWRNTGAGFTIAPVAGLPEAFEGSVAWGDYDNDGRLDFLRTGRLSDNSPISQLWRNTGAGFTNIPIAGLPGVYEGSVEWGDYDNDGRLDLLLGINLWRNTGVGFIDIDENPINVSVINANPTNFTSSAVWGDYDNDGRLDILLTGFGGISGDVPVTQVWRNTASGFTNINAGLPGVKLSSVAWGDYDNDGRLDILLAGTTNRFSATTPDEPAAILQVWRNTGTGFTNINAGLPGICRGSAAWGDYDNDGRLDILISGQGTNGVPITQIWRNTSPVANTPPNPPTGLTAAGSGSTITLSWNAASDAQTPASGLSYNVRIGTTPGGSDVFSGMSGANGLRRLPALGNSQSRLFLPFNYTLDTPYYWSVQAVDTAFAGSSFSAEGNFRILASNLMVFAASVTNQLAGDINGDGVVSQSELDAVHANYLSTSPWLYMTNVAGLGGTNVTFALGNDLSGSFTVEFSTNLSDWHQLGPATPRYLFTDTNAPSIPQRHYRLRWP